MIIDSLLSITELIFVVLIFLLGLPRVLTSIQLTKAAQSLHEEYYRDKYLVIITAVGLNVLTWFLYGFLVGELAYSQRLFLIPAVLSVVTIGIWLYFVRTIRVCDIAKKVAKRAKAEIKRILQRNESALDRDVSKSAQARKCISYHLDNLRKLAYSADTIADRNCIIDELNDTIIFYLNSFKKIEYIEDIIQNFYYLMSTITKRGNEKRELIKKLGLLIKNIFIFDEYNDDLLHSILKNSHKMVCLAKEYETNETRRTIDEYVEMLSLFALKIEGKFRSKKVCEQRIHDLDVIITELVHTYTYLLKNRPHYLNRYNYDIPKATDLFKLIQRSYLAERFDHLKRFLLMLLYCEEQYAENCIVRAFNKPDYLENAVFLSLILLRQSNNQSLNGYAARKTRELYTERHYEELLNRFAMNPIDLEPELEGDTRELVAQAPYPAKGTPVD